MDQHLSVLLTVKNLHAALSAMHFAEPAQHAKDEPTCQRIFSGVLNIPVTSSHWLPLSDPYQLPRVPMQSKESRRWNMPYGCGKATNRLTRRAPPLAEQLQQEE